MQEEPHSKDQNEDEDSDDDEEYYSDQESKYEDCIDQILGNPQDDNKNDDDLPWHLLSKSQHKGIKRRMAKRRTQGSNQDKESPQMQVYERLNQLSDAQVVALLRKGISYRDLYEASIK